MQDSLGTLAQAREMRAREVESSMKRLNRALASQQARHDELEASHSSASHASEIARLDTRKFRLAKAAQDLDDEAARLAASSQDLAARLQELEIQGIDGDPADEARRRDPISDEVLLRLSVYRSLGIDLERSGGGGGNDDSNKDAAAAPGEYTKAVIRSDRRGDVHVVNLDSNFSRHFYANYFWETL